MARHCTNGDQIGWALFALPGETQGSRKLGCPAAVPHRELSPASVHANPGVHCDAVATPPPQRVRQRASNGLGPWSTTAPLRPDAPRTIDREQVHRYRRPRTRAARALVTEDLPAIRSSDRARPGVQVAPTLDPQCARMLHAQNSSHRPAKMRQCTPPRRLQPRWHSRVIPPRVLLAPVESLLLRLERAPTLQADRC